MALVFGDPSKDNPPRQLALMETSIAGVAAALASRGFEVELVPTKELNATVVRKRLAHYTRTLGAADTFVLYTHGHGGPLGNFFAGWPWFADTILDLPARNVVVFAMSCQAGNLTDRLLALQDDWRDRAAAGRSLVVLTPVAADQNAGPSPEPGIGNPFTHAVITAVQGEADGSSGGERNGSVEMRELVDHVVAVTRAKSRDQSYRPQFAGVFPPDATFVAGMPGAAPRAPAEVAPVGHELAPRPPEGLIGAPSRLRFEVVRSILEDSKGNFWFGSWNQGVCRFDGRTLTYFTTEDGLSDNQVRSIQEDRNGVVWFEGGVGVSGFDGGKIRTPTSRDHTSKTAWQLQADDLWFKEDGAIGATGLEAQPGAYRYDGTTFTYLAYPVAADRAEVSAHATTCIAKGKNGRVWFATYTAVFGYDGEAFTVFDDRSLGLDAATGCLHVRCVLEDRKGRLWIGNNGIGVILHDGRTATQFTQQMRLGKMGSHGNRTTPQPGDVTDGSPTLHRVFAIGEDRDGNIWFGTVENGAWRYDGTSLRNFTAADGLTSKDVMAVYTDRRGDLWLAGNGVFKWNGVRFDRVL